MVYPSLSTLPTYLSIYILYIVYIYILLYFRIDINYLIKLYIKKLRFNIILCYIYEMINFYY
jgi:hypothetical protein